MLTGSPPQTPPQSKGRHQRAEQSHFKGTPSLQGLSWGGIYLGEVPIPSVEGLQEMPPTHQTTGALSLQYHRGHHMAPVGPIHLPLWGRSEGAVLARKGPCLRVVEGVL